MRPSTSTTCSLASTQLDGKAPAAAQIVDVRAETSANLRMLAGGARVRSGAAGRRGRSREGDRAAIARPSLEIRRCCRRRSPRLWRGARSARAEKYRAAGAPAEIAHDVALMRALASARETVEIAEQTSWPLAAALFVQHQVGELLGLDRHACGGAGPRAARSVGQAGAAARGGRPATAAERAGDRGDPLHGKAAPAQDKATARALVEAWIAPRRDGGRPPDPADEEVSTSRAPGRLPNWCCWATQCANSSMLPGRKRLQPGASAIWNREWTAT